MKLQDVQTWVTVPPNGIGGSFWVIVKVTTDDGIEGIGECYGIPFSGDVACRMVEGHVRALHRGRRPPRRRDPVPARVLRGLHPAPRRVDDGGLQRDRDRGVGHPRQGVGAARPPAHRGAVPQPDPHLYLSLPEVPLAGRLARRALPGRLPRRRRGGGAGPRVRRDGVHRNQAGPGRAVQLPGRSRAVTARARAQRILREAHSRSGGRPGRHPRRDPRADDHLVGHPPRAAP